MAQIDDLQNCQICPRNCKVNRYIAKGFCGVGAKVVINTWLPHYGEEPYISGLNGSGTIFFSGCNLACVFCQNYQISQQLRGKQYCNAEVVDIMLRLQDEGVHNINLVTPTHFSYQLIDIIEKAKVSGLHIPIVWNTNSYEKIETLRRLEGLVDIYLADFKYGTNDTAVKYSQADNYFEIATAAIREMFRQAGHIKLDNNGIAQSGLAVRILVLPNDLNFTGKILKILADDPGNLLYLSLMSQYYPTWKAIEYEEINRHLKENEYSQAVDLAEKYGFENCLIQELAPSPDWTPDFKV